MIFSVKKRSTKQEIMDKHNLQGRRLQRVLEDLTTVNRWLGGNNVTVDGIEKMLEGVSTDEEIRIADLGCGNGTMLKKIARWGRENGYNFKLTGIDFSESTIKIAQAECVKYPEIELLQLNILNPGFKKHKFDIITSTLTLHHFTDEEIIKLLNNCVEQSTYGVVINDLERNLKAYYLFLGFAAIFLKTKIAIKDGLTSILKGFKKEELERFATEIPAAQHEISWFWAFRYQWIIYKNERKDTAG